MPAANKTNSKIGCVFLPQKPYFLRSKILWIQSRKECNCHIWSGSYSHRFNMINSRLWFCHSIETGNNKTIWITMRFDLIDSAEFCAIILISFTPKLWLLLYGSVPFFCPLSDAHFKHSSQNAVSFYEKPFHCCAPQIQIDRFIMYFAVIQFNVRSNNPSCVT